MSVVSELRQSLTMIAKRSMAVRGACHNDASVKLYLALPMIGMLGYDSANPLEVYPNHESDPVDGVVYRADFAILDGGSPAIAWGVCKSAVDLADKRRDVATYFKSWPSMKLAVVTNGVMFEFYVDSAEPGTMDVEPFLTLDLETISDAGPSDEILETLQYATKGTFDPEMIAERAHLQLMRKRLRKAFVEDIQSPSEEFCRLMLRRVGFDGVRKEAIDRHYAPIVKASMEEALVVPVAQRLKASGSVEGKAGGMQLHVGQQVATAERELAIFNYIRRRLAFLVRDENLFAAIDRVQCKDFVGRLVIYFDRDPKGRILEIVRGTDGRDKFVFALPHSEITTDRLGDIDEALRAAFEARVREIDGARDAPVARTQASA
jgi:hypothetical protein